MTQWSVCVVSEHVLRMGWSVTERGVVKASNFRDHEGWFEIVKSHREPNRRPVRLFEELPVQKTWIFDDITAVQGAWPLSPMPLPTNSVTPSRRQEFLLRLNQVIYSDRRAYHKNLKFLHQQHSLPSARWLWKISTVVAFWMKRKLTIDGCLRNTRCQALEVVCIF